MTQTLLNFKLQSTNEKLTPRTGVAILGEYLKGMNLETLCNDNLPSTTKLITTYKVLPEKLVSCTKSTKFNSDGVKNM